MKKNMVYMIMVASLMNMTSCQPHEEVIDTSLKIGNILCANGEIIPPVLYDDGKEGVGIVIYVGTENDEFEAIAIAKKDIGNYAFSDTLYTFSSSTDVYAFDGKTNTATLLAEHDETPSINVPAAEATAAYMEVGGGWYLPSCAELRQVAANKRIIFESLLLIGGEVMDEEEWYLSSTQEGWNDDTKSRYIYCVSMKQQGRMEHREKTYKSLVRPYIMIE